MKNGNWIIWVLVLSFIVLMGFTLYYNYQYATGLACDQQGIFGDMFGASNALFTGLSVVGLITTILLQRKDLNLQKKELKKQSKTLYIQNFENTFFQLMSLLNTVVDNIAVKTKSVGLVTGKRSFNEFHQILLNAAQEQHKTDISAYSIDSKKINFDFDEFHSKEMFLKFLETYQHHLLHYFEFIYNILKLINQSKNINKVFYVSVLRSQLSNSEKKLLYYYIAFNDKNEDYETISKKLQIFKDLDQESLIFTRINSKLY